MDKNKLYVGNLPWSVDKATLKELFAPYGELTDWIVIEDKFSHKSKGFGFVVFKNSADAEKATTEMHGKEVGGRTIVVNPARPREENTGFQRRGGFNSGFAGKNS